MSNELVVRTNETVSFELNSEEKELYNRLMEIQCQYLALVSIQAKYDAGLAVVQETGNVNNLHTVTEFYCDICKKVKNVLDTRSEAFRALKGCFSSDTKRLLQFFDSVYWKRYEAVSESAKACHQYGELMKGGVE